jgi:hypothetical protein
MSAYDLQPVNKNFLSPLGFSFKIKKAPNVNYFVQSANIPSVSIETAEVYNPFVKVPFAGSMLQYSTLSVTFKIDEDMKNYLEIMAWLEGIGFPEKFQQYQDIASRSFGDGLTSDVSLFVLTSGKNPNREVVFYDAFPIDLSEVMFDTTQSDVEYLTATASFRYRQFKIQNI